MTTISLCMIVRNEENHIGKCLESVCDIVDEIIIIDTGSKDRTKDIARNYTNQVVDFQWIDDFSAARNFSFAHATKDYILWLDADDVLLEEDRNKLKKLKSELQDTIDSVTMVYYYAFDDHHNVTTSFRRNRLVKRARKFKWIGAVHEYLAVDGTIINADLAVTHTRVHSHSTRNLSIFEKRLENNEVFTPRDMYYYANELNDHQFNEKAAVYYEKYLSLQQVWKEDAISACDKLCDVYIRLGDNTKALYYAFKSFDYDSPRPELCCKIGYFFLADSQYQQAAFWYERALKIKCVNENWGFTNQACSTWLPHLQLCICYYHLGDYEKSYEHNEAAAQYRPEDVHVLHNRDLLQGILKNREKAVSV
ncbi:glycosyltransferase [Fictibacillus iocasae]|uniref:Glycosyltransferase n=1 Tax=Fictibacillus iocasae TaxID=2715437 RepID=A0ABW2NP27_9BACL